MYVFGQHNRFVCRKRRSIQYMFLLHIKQTLLQLHICSLFYIILTVHVDFIPIYAPVGRYSRHCFYAKLVICISHTVHSMWGQYIGCKMRCYETRADNNVKGSHEVLLALSCLCPSVCAITGKWKRIVLFCIQNVILNKTPGGRVLHVTFSYSDQASMRLYNHNKVIITNTVLLAVSGGTACNLGEWVLLKF